MESIESEKILREAAREGIKALADMTSTAISIYAKQIRIERVIDDLQVALKKSKGEN